MNDFKGQKFSYTYNKRMIKKIKENKYKKIIRGYLTNKAHSVQSKN